jgi:hypothetical protein
MGKNGQSTKGIDKMTVKEKYEGIEEKYVAAF